MHVAVQRRLVTIGAWGARFSSGFDPATGVLSSPSKAHVPQDVNFVDYVWQNHVKWERNTAMVRHVFAFDIIVSKTVFLL
jgi:hypothetical protein